ncbi:hypothetical protein [Actomonas aquatica]|uniref:Uncharacterized protein n=1 Tax=Actomonas aquatica TaxID=2866162 RepID=A0ABZ1C9L5_9BACT|nr:hypothetical protein [Opitutus sp. WL0086]WRQ87279.1 hypothetical protein K1X11_020900 [Opitutus sp. WL0086]
MSDGDGATPAGALPPPLPAAAAGVDRAQYATRNDGLSPACVWVIAAGALQQIVDGQVKRVVALSEVTEVRLDYAPTRVEANRYRCQLRLRSGVGITFFNRRFESFGRFADTSPAYRDFLDTLLAALRDVAPQCRFVTGVGSALYFVNVLAFAVGVLAVVGVLIFSLVVGLWALVILKALLIAFYVPRAWRWLRRNRERDFDPRDVPTAVVPV